MEDHNLPKLELLGSQSPKFLSSLIKTGYPCSSLDLTKVEFVTPVVCVLTEIAKFSGISVSFPEKINPAYYLSYMRFSQKTSQNYIPVSNLLKRTDIQKQVKHFNQLFGNWLSPSSQEFFQYALHELMDNVFDHACSKPGLWIHAQKYSNFLELAIADLGIGISKSMQNNPIYASMEASVRFVLALNLGATGKPEKHSGEGLSSVVEWIKHNSQAEGVVISLNSVWYKVKDDIGFYHKNTRIFPGTFLWFSIPREPEYDLTEIWEILDLQLED